MSPKDPWNSPGHSLIRRACTGDRAFTPQFTPYRADVELMLPTSAYISYYVRYITRFLLVPFDCRPFTMSFGHLKISQASPGPVVQVEWSWEAVLHDRTAGGSLSALHGLHGSCSATYHAHSTCTTATGAAGPSFGGSIDTVDGLQ